MATIHSFLAKVQQVELRLTNGIVSTNQVEVPNLCQNEAAAGRI